MLPSLAKLAVLVDFALRREQIARTLCENRDRPELACGGKCQLAKQLRELEPEPPEPMMPPLLARGPEMPYDLPPDGLRAAQPAPKAARPRFRPRACPVLADFDVEVFHPPESCS